MPTECVVGAARVRGRATGGDARQGSVRLRRPTMLPSLAVLPLLPLLSACGSDDTPPTAGEPLPDGVDTAVRGMRTFVTRNGIRRAVVEADTAEWHEENEIHLRPMKLTFFDPQGLESTEVTSEFGIFHQLTGDLEAERNVVVEDRRDDQRLETERLRYQNLDGRLYGDTAFILIRGLEGLTLEGTGFESDPTLDAVLMLNPEGETRPRVAYSAAASPLEDSIGTAGDTAGSVSDSLAEGPGPGEAPADQAPADPPSPADPVTAAADSATAPPDTTQAVPDSTTAPPDTTSVRLR